MHRSLLFFFLLGLVHAMVLCPSSQALPLRVSASLGYGGSGLTSPVFFNDDLVTISRAEGPATASFGVDLLIADDISVGVEHSRGAGIGPFSSQITFTGLLGRYFFLGAAPSVGFLSGQRSHILVRRFTPFAGPSLGIADGNVIRTDDQIEQLIGSGMYVGGRVGAEYPLMNGIGIRPEIILLMTLFGESSLTHFSVQCGFYVFL